MEATTTPCHSRIRRSRRMASGTVDNCPLIQTVPKFKSRMKRMVRLRLDVQTLAESLHGTPWAKRSISSSDASFWMVTTGPKTSFWTSSLSWATSVMTVNGRKKPGRSSRWPPARTRAAVVLARSRKPSTRSSWRSETTGPKCRVWIPRPACNQRRCIPGTRRRTVLVSDRSGIQWSATPTLDRGGKRGTGA